MFLRFMRPSILFIVGVLFAIAGCQSSGSSNHDSSLSSLSSETQQHEISAQLDKYTQALLNRDLAVLDRIWADDLTFVNPQGKLLSKQNRMDNIKSGATAFKSARVSELSVRQYGQVAIATFQIALEAQYSGEESSGNYNVTTVWNQVNDAWQLVAVHMTQIT